MLLPLLPLPLLKQLLDLQHGQGLVQLGLLLVIGPRGGVGPVQPVQQLPGHLRLKGHIPEIVQKGPVEGVEIRLALHQKTAAQVIEAGKAGLVEVFVQRLHQRHPLGEGDTQAIAPQEVEKILKHGSPPAAAQHVDVLVLL